MEQSDRQTTVRDLWERISSVFADLTEIPADQREAYIRTHCSDSPTVEEEVRRLLESYGESDDFLENPILGDEGPEPEGPATLYSPGDVLAERFEIVGLLGSGGMGEVYQARDGRLRQMVAIKTLRAANAQDPSTADRFRTEVLRSRQITHESACRVYELFDHKRADGREIPFFTMELLRGKTLAQWIEEHGTFQPAAALILLRQMVGALESAHKVGLVHRDFKPANIFLVRSKEGSLEAKVTDFGIAGEAGSNTDPAELPTRGDFSILAGTPAYMAPEQMAGQPTSSATDVYALGLVAYEMLTGKRLHAGDTPLACTLKRINRKHESALADLDKAPKHWSAAIARSLSESPADRFATPAEFLQALAQDPGKAARTTRRNVLIAAGATTVAVPFALWLQSRSAAEEASSSIAVLPFESASGDAQMAFLGTGFAEELTHALTAHPKLHVAAHTSADSLDPEKMTWREIGERLGVKLLVTGSVRRTESRIRVVVKLIDAETGRQRWSEIYDRDYRQVFAIQGEITSKLGSLMSLEPVQGPADREPTTIMAAYDHYLKGRFFWNRRTEQDFARGLAHFEAAVNLDSKFAPAHTGIADSYLVQADYGLIAAIEAHPKIKTALATSLSLAPNLAETHATTGLFSSILDWDQAAAERAFQKAIGLKPSLMRAHFWYGVHLMRAGRLDEAVRESETARRLDPVSLATLVFVGWVRYYKRDYPAAIAIARQALELDKSYAYAYQLLARCYAGLGRESEAVRASELASAGTDEAVRLRRRAQVLCMLPNFQDEARQAAAKLEGLSSARQAGYLAMIYAGLGDRPKMYSWLKNALDARDAAITLINVVPETEKYRREPAFRQALAHIGFQ